MIEFKDICQLIKDGKFKRREKRKGWRYLLSDNSEHKRHIDYKSGDSEISIRGGAYWRLTINGIRFPMTDQMEWQMDMAFYFLRERTTEDLRNKLLKDINLAVGW
jgi:hypothetical protein